VAGSFGLGQHIENAFQENGVWGWFGKRDWSSKGGRHQSALSAEARTALLLLPSQSDPERGLSCRDWNWWGFSKLFFLRPRWSHLCPSLGFQPSR